MRNKRVFDLVLTITTAIIWLPAVLFASLSVLICSGRPVYYRSMRRTSAGEPMRVVKFRTMVRNAAEIANRETVPVDNSTRFLNIPASSPLYTRIGRLLEKVALTELPQFSHVLKGEMSIIGNRPLPQNVMDCLAEEFSNVEDRFITPAGLTGPSQLVGRDFLSDGDRLMLEGEYCRGVQRAYSFRLDLLILLYTVLIVLRLKRGFEPAEVRSLINRYTKGAVVTDLTPAQVRVRIAATMAEPIRVPVVVPARLSLARTASADSAPARAVPAPRSSKQHAVAAP